MLNHRLPLAVVALALAGAVGCTSSTSGPDPAASSSGTPSVASPAPTTPATASGTPSAPSPTTTPPAAAPAHPVSLQAMMTKAYDGRDLRLGRVLARNDAYTRYHVTYASGRLRISGILNVPSGRGPYPVLVLAHGYIDPAVYTNGRGLAREQDYLARRGYVVLHTDYRNHAQSSDDPRAELDLRLGYTEDVINAVKAIKSSTLPALDRERVGLLGRSMGGGIAYNVLVAQPGLVDAAAVFAPVSSDAVDNFERWTRRDAGNRGLAAGIIGAYGAPEANPAFWRNLSAVNFFGRVTEPVMIHHGTADDTCPIAWSRETLAALQKAGKNVSMHTYPGEQHAFGPQWPLSMQRTVAFFGRTLRS